MKKFTFFIRKRKTMFMVYSLWFIVALFLILSTVYHIPSTNPVYAYTSLDEVNQKVCTRFEEDVSKLAAIMEEVRRRQGIKETRVAFGNVDTKIENADYWITFAAEAIAFQRAKKFSSESSLRSSLETLKGKVLRAKNEVGKAI